MCCELGAAMRWSDDANLKFMELYTGLRCLWDPDDAHYKNKSARRAALTRIAQEMDMEGFGVVEVRAKIKAFRGTFNLEYGKQQRCAESGTVYVPTLKWFNLMKRVMVSTSTAMTTKGRANIPTPDEPPDSISVKSFLEQDPLEFTGVSTSYDLQEEENQEDLEDKMSLCEESNVDGMAAAVAQDPSSPGASSSAGASSSPGASSAAAAGRRVPRGSKRRSKIPRGASTARETKVLKKSVLRTKLNRNAENEFDIFGKNVAAQLKALSPYQAITAEMEINYILAKCRFADLYASSSTQDELFSVSMPVPPTLPRPPNVTLLTSPDQSFENVVIKTEVNP